MDQMLSYCGSSSTFDESNYDIKDNLFTFNEDFTHEELNVDHVVDHNYYTKQINTLMAQCDQYQSVIKRQEKEIHDYRRHVESLEDDYSKITNCLFDTEKKAKDYKEKIDYYERTVDSLEHELDALNSQISLKEMKKSPTHISFTNEMDFKNNDNDSDISNKSRNSFKSDGFIQINDKKLISTLHRFCKQNMEMRIEIDLLKEEILRLKKDNEEYKTLLWNSKEDFNHDGCKDFRVSTPIQNFISYQSLNLFKSNSFSIDEDYEGENMIFDENFKQMSSIFNEIKQLNENTSNSSKINCSNCIENEEPPSKMIKDETTNLSNRCSTYLFSDSMKKTISREISSIEDQTMPKLNFDSTIITEMKDSFQKEVNNCCGNETITFNNNGDNHFSDKSVIISNGKFSQEKIFTLGYIWLFLVISNFKKSPPPINFRSLIMFFLVIFLIVIFKYNRVDVETRIIPYYSIEEILFDILNQYCI